MSTFEMVGVSVWYRRNTIGADADPDVESFRFMSFVIRDAAPSVQEAKDFYHGQKSLPQFIDQWMAGAELVMLALRPVGTFQKTVTISGFELPQKKYDRD